MNTAIRIRLIRSFVRGSYVMAYELGGSLPRSFAASPEV